MFSIVGTFYLIRKKTRLIPMNGWIHFIFIAEQEHIIFFLLAKNQVGVDKNISPDKHAIQSLIAYHAKGYTVGIHPSWQSGDEQAVLMEEIDILEKIIKSPVKYSRQHYLRVSLPQTYRKTYRRGYRKRLFPWVMVRRMDLGHLLRLLFIGLISRPKRKQNLCYSLFVLWTRLLFMNKN